MDATEWDARYESQDLVWGAEPNRWLVAEATALPAGRALDVACGEGRNALWLASRGWQVTGVDFSGVALTRAGQLAEQAGLTSRLQWVRVDVGETNRWEAAFDLVVIAYLHLPRAQRRRVLRATAGALAPAGTLLVIAHDQTNLDQGTGGPQDPDLLFTAQDVVDDLADLPSLIVERAERVLRSIVTPEGERQAIDLLVRMRRA